MKQQHTNYKIIKPPKTLRQVTLDNIALVPASLLANKNKYQTITQNLPKGSVLICEIPQKPQISQILSQVASILREQGHMVRILPYSLLL